MYGRHDTRGGSSGRGPVKLPTNCQPSDQEEIRKAVMNPDHQEADRRLTCSKQAQSGSSSKSQDVVLITSNPTGGPIAPVSTPVLRRR